MKSVNVVLKALDDLLLPLGFRRQQESWNRRSGPFVDVIDVQLSEAGDTMTANVGVLDPDIYSQCWGEDAPSVVSEPKCTVRARLGHLIDGNDRWWLMGSPDFCGVVESHALPFLDRMHAPGGMEKFLMAATSRAVKNPYPPPLVYLALLMNKRGDRPSSCKLLGDLQDRVLGGWRTRVRQLALRLGCP